MQVDWNSEYYDIGALVGCLPIGYFSFDCRFFSCDYASSFDQTKNGLQFPLCILWIHSELRTSCIHASFEHHSSCTMK